MHLMDAGFWVYIATNKNATVLYVGMTNDLMRRMYEHRNKTNPKSFAARYNVNRLVWYETLPTAADAIAVEKKIKGLLRAKKVELIQQLNPTWSDLSEE